MKVDGGRLACSLAPVGELGLQRFQSYKIGGGGRSRQTNYDFLARGDGNIVV